MPRSPATASTSPPAGSTQRITAAITQAVVERRLMPGTRLAEQQIASLFGVSRTIVRQALNQLSRDRLVTLSPARGAAVAQPGIEEARQVFEVRQLLEGAMVRRLAGSITAAQVQALRAHVAQERAAVARADVPGRTRLLADFHAVLAQMLGNEVLAQLLSDLLGRCSLIALMYQSAPSAEASLAGHVAIVDALERHDTRAAVRLTQQHLAHVERNLRLHPRSSLAPALQPGLDGLVGLKGLMAPGTAAPPTPVMRSPRRVNTPAAHGRPESRQLPKAAAGTRKAGATTTSRRGARIAVP